MRLNFCIKFIFFINIGVFCNLTLPDSSLAKVGLSLNYFSKYTAVIGLEFQPNSLSKNIYGIGNGYTIYFLRKIPGLQRNLVTGLPVILSRNRFLKENDPSIVYNFFRTSPFVGLQFDLGKRKFVRLRATYSPVVLNWIKNEQKEIVKDHYYNQIGFSVICFFW